MRSGAVSESPSTGSERETKTEEAKLSLRSVRAIFLSYQPFRPRRFDRSRIGPATAGRKRVTRRTLASDAGSKLNRGSGKRSVLVIQEQAVHLRRAGDSKQFKVFEPPEDLVPTRGR